MAWEWIPQVIKGLGDILLKYGMSIRNKRPQIPRQTLRIVPREREMLWMMDVEQSAMNLKSRWHLTNVTDKVVRVTKVMLSKPKVEGVAVVAIDYATTDAIPPGATADVAALFCLRPPTHDEGADLRTTVVFVDQYGNEHKARKVVFKGRPRVQPKSSSVTTEYVYAIMDPLEKDIASVLKSEVARYESCGRRTGGMGSVRTCWKGRTMHGVAGEARDSDSPWNQSIVANPAKGVIVSDNASTLIAEYDRLNSSEDRGRFVDALLTRLSRNIEYESVGYLIGLVTFRIGLLHEALTKAKTDLQGDSANAFSDFLRLLDGLLRFEHSEFSDELLDEVEEFARGLQEHTFRIQERIASARAFRLARKVRVENSLPVRKRKTDS